MDRTLSRLSLVRIGSPLPGPAFQVFADRLRNALGNILRKVQIVEFEPPPVEQIEARLLTSALDERIGGHVLGVTDVDLMDSQGDDFFPFMFGGKDSRSHVAVVSTCRLESRDPAVRRDRAFKVALHELGHNFGLVHHYSFERSLDGAYCPMSKGDFNRYGERAYVRSVIDGRGFSFCASCQSFLEHFHGAYGHS